jgi:SAM-dependent methyltransferase
MQEVENIARVSRVEVPDFHTNETKINILKSNPTLLDLGNDPIDLVISAFALHWSNDLPGALIQLRNIIQPDGLFLGVLAGPDTLNELRECLAVAESEILGGITPRVDPFITVQAAGALMQRAGFALPVVDTEKIIIRYNTMYDLINDLRAMAATNVLCLRETQKFSKILFTRAAEIYASRFADEDGRIRATFELIFLSGWVPHQSQQKPSKPGSVTIRLADAIKN